MPYKQLHSPNTKVSAPAGWCLNTVQRSFGAPWSGLTATDAWNRAKYKHAGVLPPKGIAVPLYFSLSNNPAGHVVVWMPDGSVYSASDYDEAFDYHPSVQALEKFYGGKLRLRGWSEDLNGWRVVEETKGEDDMITKPAVDVLFRLMLGKEPTADDVKYYTTHYDFGEALDAIRSRKEYKDLVAAAKAGKLDPKRFLPDAVRKVYKAPVAPSPPSDAERRLKEIREAIETLANLAKKEES